jgi:hypothetical protein
LIAGIAIAGGVCALLLMDHWQAVHKLVAAHFPVVALAVAALLLALGLLLFKFKPLQAMNVAPVWATWAADRPQYYLVALADRLPLLWPLFPVAVTFAWQRERRLTLYSTIVFVIALSAHSLAAAKAERYLYYATPFFGVVWGCAVAGVVEWVAARPAADRWRSWAVVLAAGVLVLALSREGQRGARLLLASAAPQEILSYASEPDWQPAVGQLQPALAAGSRVVTSNAMKALYYLGRYDFEMNVSIVGETDTGRDFGVDSRTGGRAIGSAAALRTVIDWPGHTLVVLEDRKLHSAQGVPSAAVDVLSSRCAPLVLPSGGGLSAWQCAER